MVVHYDAYGLYLRTENFKFLQAIIGNSDKITVLTVYVSPEELLSRTNKRTYLFAMSLRVKDIKPQHFSDRVRAHCLKRDNYEANLSNDLYQRWFEVIGRANVHKHWV